MNRPTHTKVTLEFTSGERREVWLNSTQTFLLERSNGVLILEASKQRRPVVRVSPAGSRVTEIASNKAA